MSTTTIYTGIWKDYSKSPSNQLVLTLTSTSGQILIAAAAIMVQLAGAAIWIVVAFCLHQRHANHDLRDEFDAQRDIILRNSSLPAAIIHFWSLGKSWHKHAPQALIRTLRLLTIPLFIKIGFVVAGVLSTTIAYDQQSSHVLIVPSHCGTLPLSATAYEHRVNTAAFVLRARAYARECYLTAERDVDCSTTWPKNRLSYNVIRNASCPLESGYCSLGDNGAVTLWTMLDSHEDLGINAPVEDRVGFGYNLTCAPLQYELVKSFAVEPRNLSAFFNGSSFGYRTYTVDNMNLVGFTYNNISAHPDIGTPQYSVQSFSYFSGRNKYTKAPYDTLRPPFDPQSMGADIDTQLIFIMPNAVIYANLSDDPIFGTALQSSPNNQSPPYNFSTYHPLHEISGIACWQSWSFCNPTTSICSDWLGSYDLEAAFFSPSGVKGPSYIDALRLNQRQFAAAQRLDWIKNTLTMPDPLRVNQQLLAMGYVSESGVSSLHTQDSWYREVLFWYETILASMPITSEAFVDNPDAEDVDWLKMPELSDQCHQQRRKLPTGYQNFSVLGLLIILIVGAASILVAAFLREYNHKLPRRKPGQAQHHKALAWWADGMLQVHRRALEGWLGVDGWKEDRVPFSFENVPVTSSASKRVPPMYEESKEDLDKLNDSGSPLQFSLDLNLPSLKPVHPSSELTHGWETVTQYDVDDAPRNRHSSGTDVTLR